MNSNQHSTRFDGRSNIFAAKHVIGGTRRRHMPTCALDRLDMLTKSDSRIRDSFLDCLSGRETSLNVGEPDAESAIQLFLDDSYIMHRHLVDTPPHTRSRRVGKGEGTPCSTRSELSYAVPTMELHCSHRPRLVGTAYESLKLC
jgi:hypothetical protein